MSNGYQLVNFCEFDKYAEKSYCAVHSVDPSLNLGDITEVDENNLAPFNMICGGSPCFVEGTLVLTENGYIPIEQVQIGDMVLTHNNRYCRVNNTMVRETDELIGIGVSPSEIIYCTKEHPFYVRKKSRRWDNERATKTRLFAEPEWIEAKDIGSDYYVGTAINRKSELPTWDGYSFNKNKYKKPENEVHRNELSEMFYKDEFWYIVGRYIGDGWLKTYDGKTVIICGNDNEIGQITEALDYLGLNYCVVHEKTVVKIQVVKKELYLYLSQFGHGAANKHLTKDILNLPKDKLISFLSGYIDSDGSFTQGKYKASSVSRRLIYEIGQCVAKAYERPFSIYFTARPKTHLIEGRVVNQKDSYQVVWKMEDCKQDHAFYENGYIWSPITKTIEDQHHELVYNLEVDSDNSYVVQNVIVHNCQDFSVAGSQKGSKWVCNDCGHTYNPLTVHYSSRDHCPKCFSTDIDKTRSSLLVEWLRIIRANKPNWCIYENVKNLVGKKFKDTFQMFLDELDEYGYNCYYQVLNAKDFGVPQNRERVYLIAIKKELDNGKFKFPDPLNIDVSLKDVLEEDVNEKYYINSPKAAELIEELKEDGKLEQDVSRTVRSGGERVVT